jgi:NAD(P)-dependent dehydrogenase (short-subunit alcohol dehydrogenase family)
MKTVILTGTSSGIGYELAKRFAALDFEVLALSRNTTKIDRLNHPNLTAIATDFREPKTLKAVASFLQNQGKQIDILVNNAGSLVNKPFEKTTPEDFLDVYKVNVFGAAELIKTALPWLKKGSHVVNISSMGGMQGSTKFAGLAAYSSSKAALIGLTELLAEEYKERGIAFNALALGAVQTEMLSKAFPDFKAPLKASEMADYIVHFATTGHRYYNGKILPVANSTP